MSKQTWSTIKPQWKKQYHLIKQKRKYLYHKIVVHKWHNTMKNWKSNPLFHWWRHKSICYCISFTKNMNCYKLYASDIWQNPTLTRHNSPRHDSRPCMQQNNDINTASNQTAFKPQLWANSKAIWLL